MSRTQQEEQNDHECELAAWELLEEAKATADLWIQKAKQAEQAAVDLKAELEDTRREWKEEIAAVQARLLDPHAVYINMLHGKIAKLDWEKLEHIHGNHPAREQLAAERALSDRLHGALDALDYNLAFAENTAHGSLGEKITAMRAIALPAIEAWKEARSE